MNALRRLSLPSSLDPTDAVLSPVPPESAPASAAHRRLLRAVGGAMAALAAMLTAAWLIFHRPSGSVPLSPAQEVLSMPFAVPSDQPTASSEKTLRDPVTESGHENGAGESERTEEASGGGEPSPPPIMSADDYVRDGRAALSAKQMDRLKRILDEGMRRFPGSDELWSMTAAYYFYSPGLRDREKNALAAARRAVELSPGDPGHHVNLGWIFQELSGDYAAALVAYRKGESFAERNPTLHLQMGVCAETLFDFTAAAGYYRRFLQAAPYDAGSSRALVGLARFKREDLFLDPGERSGPVVWEGEYLTILIDRECFKAYPAVFLSLDQGRLVELPPAPEELNGLPVDADLWIEPRDPEISALAAGTGNIRHLGSDAALAVVEGDRFTEGRSGVESWLERIPPDLIRPGLVFRVRSSRGRIFKLRVDDAREDALVLSIRVLAGTSP